MPRKRFLAARRVAILRHGMEPATQAASNSKPLRNLAAFALLIVVTLLVRLPLLDVPFERDEGEYAYIGWRLAHGELPYRDWVDQKPPAIFWIYRLALAIPGDPVRAVHLFAAIWSAASVAALYLVARRLMPSPWAAVAGGLLAILSAHPIGEGTAANTEIFMLFPMILSVWAFFKCAEPLRICAEPSLAPKAPRRALPMLACGALIGLATAFKQVAAINWLFLVCASPFVFHSGKDARWKPTAQFALWSALGAVLVWALIGGCFAFRGGFNALLYNVLTHNLEYIHATPWPDRIKLCRDTLAKLSRVQAVAWAFAVIGLVAAIRRPDKALFVFAAGWLVASFVGVSASGYYFPHYFQQWLPPLVLSAVLGAQTVANAPWWKGISNCARAAVITIALAILPLATWAPFARMSPVQASRRIFPFNIFGEMPQIAGYIAQATNPEDRVFIFGAEAEILFYARRVSATRYIFLFPLYGPYRDARQQQEATAREVAANSPRVVAYFPNGLFYQPGTEQFFSQWTESYLRDQFRPAIYVTRDAAGAAQFTQPSAGHSEFAAPAGEQLVGIIFVRK
jgi:4-amino-4-deoxy-L-arabinose transferase-like glycosyltransferase